MQGRFGRKLRDTRLRIGISQERLAELAGLHRTYVSGVERGERNISLVNIERLAKALGVSMADLMP
ncbi:MAG: helix-turn-helix transcriptional regulator [Pirellulales bacterium]